GADLVGDDGLRPLGTADLDGKVAVGVQDGIVRAGSPAGATVDTDLRVDEVVCLLDAADGVNRADQFAGAAPDALVCDEEGHSEITLLAMGGTSSSIPGCPRERLSGNLPQSLTY